MRFTDHQFYMMRRLGHGVNKEEFWRWDQRQTRGLYFRGMFKFVNPKNHNGVYAIVTDKGWQALRECTTPKYRMDATRPIFKMSPMKKVRHA